MKMSIEQFAKEFSAYTKLNEYIKALADGEIVEMECTQVEDENDWYTVIGYVVETAEPVEDSNGDYTAVNVYYSAVDADKDPYDDEQYKDADSAESAVQSAYTALVEERQELVNDFWRCY